MENEGDIDPASTANVKQDDGTNHQKGRNNLKKNDELMYDPTPSEVLTSHSPSSTEASDDERGEKPVDITPRME